MKISHYFLALSLTLIIEVVVAYILGYKSKKKLLAVILASLVTHPLASYILWINTSINIFHVNYISIIFFEIIIILVESFLLYFVVKQKYLNALKISLSMNTASFIFGLLIFEYNF